MMYRWDIARRRTGNNKCELVLVYWTSGYNDKNYDLSLDELHVLDLITDEELHNADRVFGVPFKRSNAYTPIKIFFRLKDYLYKIVTCPVYNFNEW